uniref:Uncharacterized protein n=2 Tax=Oryza sativa subsp. japonica TaxID=39947 RepID=Q2R526_ORYSJ|nr:hypothetical protein [Oryza sativa Japonica Group]AAX95931.1 hypothetical protein LOC_Os11g26470 [Oryza sativa Japonica Group]ABA93387.1 hypothetical protein LOC_Os11g26470 [Oryza sativa Japonica Group]
MAQKYFWHIMVIHQQAHRYTIVAFQLRVFQGCKSMESINTSHKDLTKFNEIANNQNEFISSEELPKFIIFENKTSDAIGKINMHMEREICNDTSYLSGARDVSPKLGFHSESLIRIESVKAEVSLKIIVLLLHQVVDVGELSISILLLFLRLCYVFLEVVFDLSHLHIKGIHSPGDSPKFQREELERHSAGDGGILLDPGD